MNDLLVYDIEILRAVPSRTNPRIDGVEYCAGWEDKENMGVAVICAFHLSTKTLVPEGRFRVFSEGNFGEFQDLAADAGIVAGFNSIAFDDVVCGHAGIQVATDYDLLQELWKAAGLEPTWQGQQTHGGFSLNRTAQVNGYEGKTGFGGNIPVDWQQGRYGRVIDYCLEDVRLTHQLIHDVQANGYLKDPRDGVTKLPVRLPA